MTGGAIGGGVDGVSGSVAMPADGSGGRSPTAPAHCVRDGLLSWISQPDAWVALLTLTVLEIVLGIDNIVFIPCSRGDSREQQARARTIGLGAALVMRVLCS